MSLEPAIVKAWGAISGVNLITNTSVQFLGDEFVVDVNDKKILMLPHKTPADDCLIVLILHYLAQKITGLPVPTGEWLSLTGLSIVLGFAEVFKKRAIDMIVRKFGSDPDGIYKVLEKAPGQKVNQADAAITLEAFEGIPVLIELWQADEEYGPEGNILFDKNITQIFCTEDILVFAEVVARTI